jgi:hypothetical protein
MNKDKLMKRIQRYVDFITKITVRIIQFNSEKEITGHRSGFVYQSADEEAPMIITAGHGCPPSGCFVETRIRTNNGTCCYNAGEFNIFYTEGEIDFAYSLLPIDIIRNSLPPEFHLEIPVYRHSFGTPIHNEAYGFAVWNNYEFVKEANGFLLPQYCCYEVGMELVAEDDWQYLFKTMNPLNKDEYYEGASGAPITDPEGRICSILLGREGEYLHGQKLERIAARLKGF